MSGYAGGPRHHRTHRAPSADEWQIEPFAAAPIDRAEEWQDNCGRGYRRSNCDATKADRQPMSDREARAFVAGRALVRSLWFRGIVSSQTIQAHATRYAHGDRERHTAFVRGAWWQKVTWKSREPGDVP